MEKDWPKNRKWPIGPKWGKNRPKMVKKLDLGSFLYFFTFLGHFCPISGRGPFSFFFGQFFPIFGFRPVFHSIPGGLTRKARGENLLRGYRRRKAQQLQEVKLPDVEAQWVEVGTHPRPPTFALFSVSSKRCFRKRRRQ